jgi:hypothetical protein
MGRHALLFLGLVVFLAGGGCDGGGQHPVKGKILVKGQPAVGAQVMLFPEGPPDMNFIPPTGTAAADGTFDLATGGKPGAPAGKYIVTVIWPDPNKQLTAAEKMQGLGDVPDLLKGQYATRDKSTLRAEVKGGGPTALDPIDIK